MIRVVQNERGVEALLMRGEEEVGHFTVSLGTTASVGIGIDEEYRGKGHSIKLMRSVVDKLAEDGFASNLYVDTDASEGFWKHVGFRPNPLYNFDEAQREIEGAGYEMVISFNDLKNYINNKYGSSGLLLGERES